MLRFLSATIKVLLLVVLLAALALAILNAVYGERIRSEIRAGLETEMSKMSDAKVTIESIAYIFPLSFAMNGIDIVPNDPRDERADMDRLTLTVDPFTLFKDNCLTSVILIQRFRKGDIVWNAEIKTTSHPAKNITEALSPDLLETVSVLNAELKLGRLKISDILGTLDIKNGKVNGGKVDFGYKKEHYFLVFKALDPVAKKYDVSFRTNNLSVACRISKEPSTVIIESLKGMFYIMKFDLTGELKDPTSSKSQLSLTGTVGASLEGIASLPDELGKFGREHNLSGIIRSTVDLKAAEPDVNLLDISGNLAATQLRFDDMKLKQLTTKWTFRNSRFSAPAIKADIYGGRLTGKLSVDVEENYLPYRSEMKILYMDFGALVYDATKKKVTVFGTLDSTVRLNGLFMKPDSVVGDGSMRIYDAGLGPMPIVTPLLGNIYSSLETYFPDKYKINLSSFAMDFDIKDKRVSSSNIVLGSKVADIKAEGYVDFNGNIDFRMQNELKEPKADDFSGWQISLRRAITEIGQNLGKARVRGTFNDPKWDFEFARAK